VRALATAAFLALSLCFGLSVGPAHAEEQTPALRALIQAAAKEGSLTLTYGSTIGGADGVRKLEPLINKKYGLHLTFVYTPGPSQPEMAARIAQEAAAGRPASTDIFATSMAPESAKIFAPIDWRDYVPGLPADAMKYDRRGLAYGTAIFGISYNTKLVAAKDAPRSLKDLLKPEWQGKIAVRATATDMAYLALPQVLGPDGALAFYRALVRSSAGLMRCGNTERILSGEFPVFFPDCGENVVMRARGLPVGLSFPTEGAALFHQIGGVPQNAPHPNAARLFFVFMLSPEGQAFLWDEMASDCVLLPGSKIAALVAAEKARGVKFYDTYDVEERNPKLLETQKAMQQILNESANH